MSGADRMSNAAEDLKGKAKEGFGKATGDQKTQAEGAGDQAKAHSKNKIEDAKDKLADGASKLKDKFTK